jgi:hypothetical protein
MVARLLKISWLVDGAPTSQGKPLSNSVILVMMAILWAALTPTN